MATGGVTQSVSSLLAQTAPYSVTSSIAGDSDTGYGVGAAQYTGNTTGGIWEETNKMGKDQFLHLLTIQLKYQDPLSPMDNTAFVSQLAQFRALETGENTENAIRELGRAFDENLAAQIVSSQSIANSSAMSLIGHEARMRQTSVSWSSADTQVPIRVHLGNSDKANVEILDDDGNVVRTIAASGKDAQNSVTIYWDGKTDDGTKVKAGKYSLNVVGSDKDSSLYTYVQEIVEGVRFTGEGAMIKIGGKEISIGEVLDVSMNEGGGGGYITPSNALSMLGKTVRARYDEIRHTAYGVAEGVDYPINVNASRNSQVEVQIKNGRGDVVATLKGIANDFGDLSLNWDGYTDDGEMAPVGVYSINVVGSDKNTSLYAYTEGVVDGITSLTGDFKMKVNGVEVALNDILSVSTKATSSALTAPATVGANVMGPDTISLGWSSVAGATGYYVYRSTSPNGTYSYLASTSSAAFTNTGLDPDTAYYYKVSAYNSAGEGAQSSYITAKTDAV